MSGFPSLEPAFTARLRPADGFSIGSTARKSSFNVIPIESGTITSEPGFPISLKAEVVHGADYVRSEASPTHMRINVKAVLKNADGDLLSYSYKGLVEVNEEFLAIYSGSPDAKTTSYGNSLTHIVFETGSESLKELEHSLFVGSAHFIVEGDGKFLIETKISRVRG